MLRSIALSAAALLPLLTSGVASANVNDVSMRFVVFDAAEECATEVRVEMVESDLFNGNETLMFDGVAVGTFAPLSETRTTISAGTRVLFASPAFTAATGIAPDVEIADAECASLEAGSAITFQGSFGGEAGSLALPAGFGLRSLVGPSGVVTDLEAAAILLYDSTNASYEIGEGPLTSDGGGCRVGAGRSSGAAGWLMIASIGFALALRVRRVRRRSRSRARS